MVLLVSLAIYAILFCIISCGYADPRPIELLNQILDKDPLITEIPIDSSISSSPLEVTANLLIRRMESIDDNTMDFTIDTTFWQEWMDPRLSFNHTKPITLQGITNRIWSPDMHFVNSKRAEVHGTIKPNTYMRVFPNGKVLYSNHVAATLACPMNLQYFPLDRQVCFVLIGSYSFQIDELILKWAKTNPVRLYQPDQIKLPKFKLQDMRATETCADRDRDAFYSGKFTCIEVRFEFSRQLSYYINSIYIPTTMIVLISWVSFWIGIDVLEARLSLGITALLTLATQMFGISQTVPVVSYTKALDVWVAVCLIYVNLSILQVSALMVISKQKENCIFQNRLENKKGTGTAILSKTEVMINIDRLARIAFPTSFTCFVILYWATLLLVDQTSSFP